MRERSEHDKYMDTLVLRMSEHLDGAKCSDVASAAAMIMAFALHENDKREAILQDLVEFIHEIWMSKSHELH